MWEFVYLFVIIMMTCFIFYLYYMQRMDYNREMQRIEILEQVKLQKQRELENIRSMTTACPMTNLNDPRSCFVKSDYTCKWNESADRCDYVKSL